MPCHPSRPPSRNGYAAWWFLAAAQVGQPAEAAGVLVAGFAAISGHSCRVGAAQGMVRHGIEMPSVMQAGGWRTMEMVARYAKHLEVRRAGSAKLSMLQNRE